MFSLILSIASLVLSIITMIIVFKLLKGDKNNG